MNVSQVGRKHSISASQLFNWRKLEREGALVAVHSKNRSCRRVSWQRHAPRSRNCSACWAKRQYKRRSCATRSTWPAKKVDCALTLIRQGRAVKPVCVVLGVARSHVIDILARPVDWVDRCTVARLDPVADAMIAGRTRRDHGAADLWLSSCRRPGEPYAQPDGLAPRESQVHVPCDEGTGFAAAEIAQA